MQQVPILEDMVIDIELLNHSLWKWFANRGTEMLMQTVNVIALQFVFEEIYMGKEFIYILPDLKRTSLEQGFCLCPKICRGQISLQLCV